MPPLSLYPNLNYPLDESEKTRTGVPGEKAGAEEHYVWFLAYEPGCAGGVWRELIPAVPVTCGEVERGGFPARCVAAVHLLRRHQPLDSLHVPVAARLEQLAGGRFHCLGRRARAPAGAAAARHDPGRRRQQQRQQRQ